MQISDSQKLQLASLWRLRRPVSFILVFLLLYATLIVLVGVFKVNVDTTEGRASTGVTCRYSGGDLVCTDEVHAFYGGYVFQAISLIGFVLMLVATFQISLGHEYGFWAILGKDRLPKNILTWTVIVGGIIAIVGSLGYVLFTGDKTDKWGARYDLPTPVWKITIPVALLTILFMAVWLILPEPPRKPETATSASKNTRLVLLILIALALLYFVYMRFLK